MSGRRHVRTFSPFTAGLHALRDWLLNCHIKTVALESTGLCPDNRISGGRLLKAGTRKVSNRIANILRMAANALSREQGRRMGEFVRRFKGRLGKAEGIVVGAHKLARILAVIQEADSGLGRRANRSS
jgi:hypothetical protein